MKGNLNFILLGVFCYLLSMIILTLFMEAEIALYFSPLAVFFIAAVLLFYTGTQNFLIPEIVEDQKSEKDRRKSLRYRVEHYPSEITIPDGTKIDVLLNEVSSGGFQILCKDTDGQNILQKIAQLEKKRAPKVELTTNVPFSDRLAQIKAKCKVAYIAENEYEIEGDPCVVGLQVTRLKGESNFILKKLMFGHAPALV